MDTNNDNNNDWQHVEFYDRYRNIEYTNIWNNMVIDYENNINNDKDYRNNIVYEHRHPPKTTPTTKIDYDKDICYYKIRPLYNNTEMKLLFDKQNNHIMMTDNTNTNNIGNTKFFLIWYCHDIKDSVNHYCHDYDDDISILLENTITHNIFNGNIIFVLNYSWYKQYRKEQKQKQKQKQKQNEQHQQQNSNSNHNHHHRYVNYSNGIHHNQYISNCIFCDDRMNYNIEHNDKNNIDYNHMNYLSTLSIKYNHYIENYCFHHHVTIQFNTKLISSSLSSSLSLPSSSNYKYMEITVGPEAAGGYNINVSPEDTMIQVANQIIHYNDKTKMKKKNRKSQQRGLCSIILSCSTIEDTKYINNLYMCSNTSIIRCIDVQNVLLYSHASIKNNSIVHNVILQWYCSIVDNSHVTNTFVMEHSHIGPNSYIINTILGNDVHVSNGEIQYSIIGNNTAIHHQSLCISNIWLTGHGNIGYGSNIGSNHTGRISDQSIISSEGIFYGLNCSIIMPINLSLAYYTLIAANTKLISGICTMPFALIINNKDGEVDVIPGWLYQHSPYTILRNNHKYNTRTKSKYHKFYTDYHIIRVQTIHQCYIARTELYDIVKAEQTKAQTKELSSFQPSLTTIVTKSNENTNNHNCMVIPKTTYHISSKSCTNGIQIYTDCMQRYALSGLYNQLILYGFHNNNNSTNFTTIDSEPTITPDSMLVIISQYHKFLLDKINPYDDNIEEYMKQKLFHYNPKHSNVPCWPVLPWEIQSSIEHNHDMVWSYQLWLIYKEFSTITNQITIKRMDNDIIISKSCNNNDDVKNTLLQNMKYIIVDLLKQYLELETLYYHNIYRSRNRDWERGQSIQPGYIDCHDDIINDPMLIKAKEESVIIQTNIQSIQKQYHNIINTLQLSSSSFNNINNDNSVMININDKLSKL